MPSHRDKIAALENKWSVSIEAAWRNAIKSITSNIDRRKVIDRLKAGDVRGAVSLLHLHRSYFASVLTAILSAYQEAGDAERVFVGARQPFDPYDPISAHEFRDHTEDFIDRATGHAEQNATEYFADGLSAGIAASVLASYMIGSFIGLTIEQRRRVISAQDELVSGRAGEYLARKHRNRGLDGQIREVIAKEGAVSMALARVAARLYASNLAAVRAKLIGRVEGGIAIGSGRFAAAKQAYRAVGVSDPYKKWRSQRDERVRDTHVALDGQVVHVDDVFHSPSGATLRFPKDPEAPLSEIASCRCWVQYDRVTARRRDGR